MAAQPIISTTIQARSQLKQYDTEVVTRETVLDILTHLGLSPDSELTRMVVNDNRGKSILARIFDGLSSAGFDNFDISSTNHCSVHIFSSSDVSRDLGARPRQEHSIPETMRIIDAKYDKILGGYEIFM